MMTDISTLSKFHLGDMIAEYLVDQTSQVVSLRLYPSALENQLAAHREHLNPQSGLAWRLESLVQFKLLGDMTYGYSQGSTMRNSATVATLRLENQQVIKEGDQTTIITRLTSERGYAGENYLNWRAGDGAVRVNTIFYNLSEHPLTLEMLSSFSLSGITPFAIDDAPQRLYIHRFRSAWSAEGRHECRLVEEMGLERSWAQHGVRVERFGQVGSMPVKGFFPWAGVEDREMGVLWGAQLVIPGSWQMEFFRQDDFLCLSGGLADREFGHWTKAVAPGEHFASPFSYLSTVQGSLDDLCARMVDMQLPAAETAPPSEIDLPVICNEYCYSWGDPRHADLVAMADRLQDSGVKYLIIDAGWYKGNEGSWYLAQGDWAANPRLFPDGLAATAQAIRKRGLIPGIWFEMEVCGEQSPRYTEDIDHFLHRDGMPLTAAGRHFWDFRDPWVIDFLSQKVIGLLHESGFGYIKVDYNETIGIGVDGAESLGEGLRQHLEGVQGFFRKMRTELPELVIENCASGGHRLEPSMMALSSMASFSDAHETKDIPVIAANLHRLILPRQSQIWAVLHATDSTQRLAYLLSSGFLGRLCISGEITALNKEQWALVKEAIHFYKQLTPVIARGKSRLFQAISPSWQHLQGAQVVLRIADDEQSAFVVTHSFEAPLPVEIRVPLPGDGWQVAGCFPASSTMPEFQGNELCYLPSREWEGKGIYLMRST
jgi:alpha-galactosidase